MKVIKYPKLLTNNDILDITLMVEARELQKFAINYRANIEEQWYEVYRVDNYHGFLHEQRYWRGPETIVINDKQSWSLQMIFEYYIEEVVDSYARYRTYYEESLRTGKIERKEKDEKRKEKNN